MLMFIFGIHKSQRNILLRSIVCVLCIGHCLYKIKFNFLLFMVYFFVVCGLLFVVCGLLFVVCGLWSPFCGLWSVVSFLWSGLGLTHSSFHKI